MWSVGPRRHDVGDRPSLRRVERTLRLAVAFGHTVERELDERRRPRLARRRRPVPECDDELAPLRDVRRGARVRVLPRAAGQHVHLEHVLRAVDQGGELGARGRGGEVALVFLAGQGERDDQPRAEPEGHARADAIRSLGERAQEREGRARVAAPEIAEHLRHAGLELRDVLQTQVAMAAEPDEERQRAARPARRHGPPASTFSTR